jgi:hypothetical protein
MNFRAADLLKTYTDAEAASEGLKGKVWVERDTPYGTRVWKFVKNTAADAVTATAAKGMIVQITSFTANEVQPLGTLHEKKFGGVRQPYADSSGALVAPDSWAQNTWAWVQILGYALFMLGDSATAVVAGSLIVPDDDTDLGRVGGVLVEPATNSAANIALHADSHDSAFAVAVAASAGVADEVVAATIFRNFWGQYS